MATTGVGTRPVVRPSDTRVTIGDNMSDRLTREERWIAEREAVPAALEANRDRRARAEHELHAARQELQGLLARGQAVALGVAAMARDAGVSRDTAHRLLRDAGSRSWRQEHKAP